MPDKEVSRRAFLKASGGLVVTFVFASPSTRCDAAALTEKTVSPDEVGGFIAIDANGLVTLYSGKVELGTGVLTAITQIIAEELSVPFASVTTIQGDTLLTPNQGPTYASFSIQNGGAQIRRAAATARDALLTRASSKLGVAKDLLRIDDGLITPKSGGKGLSYAQLLAGQTFTMKVNRQHRSKIHGITKSSVPRLLGSTFPAKFLANSPTSMI